MSRTATIRPTRRRLINAAPALLLPGALSIPLAAASGEALGDPTVGRKVIFDEPFAGIDTEIWNAGPKATRAAQGHYGIAAFSRFGGEEGFDPYAIIDDPQAEDGKALQITAKYIGRPMQVVNYYGNLDPKFQWLTGNIQTGRLDGTVSRGWRNGYFEARMWVPEHPLTWPAFWLLNRESILRPQQSIEIDIVEHKGWELDLYGAYLHEWGEPGERHEGTGVRTGVNVTKGYHLYGVLIDGPRCIPFFDRKQVHSPVNGQPISWTIARAPMLDAQQDLFWPLIGLALREDGPVRQPLPPEQREARLRVDYFRVYG
ncbi:family 16 glycosylhydrolase [Bosea sp. BH3]|uniref:glycoside hydrolase family 16 protein n=1 Tax=Bosea sp. BH3 TaxID=2871701 RepID=UPI0021CAE3D8|nr:family 16 glycosylhydrolase [Bosea sp. BH3]MCU4181121.1 family 16 glycosylhydrolase [Bosea sp. BH3]